MKKHGPRTSSSCAACKTLKRRCVSKCIFAPYFPSDETKKFAKVHKVFGASNVSKILIQVPEEQREETVNSLAYEAEARLSDPVYGCIGAIALLQRKMAELQHDLAVARACLAQFDTTINFDEGVDVAGFGKLPRTIFGGMSESLGQSSFSDSGNPLMSDFHHHPYIY